MKKEFVKATDVKETAGVKVGNEPTPTPVVKETANGFVKYGEVSEDKMNIFRNITLKPTGDFLKIKEDEPTCTIPLALIKMASMRYSLEYVASQIKFKVATDNPTLMNCVADVLVTKDKQILAVLNKGFVVKPQESGIFGLMLNDPSYRINLENIPDGLKALAEGEFRVQSYGDDLVVVLDPMKITTLLFGDVCDGSGDIADYVKLSNPVVQHDYFHFAVVTENVDGCVKQLSIKRDQLACARLQITHEQLQEKAYMWLNSRLVSDVKDMLVFVRTADIASQPNGYEAINQQLAGSPNMQTIPLLKIVDDRFKSPLDSRVSSNGLLSMLIQKSNKIDTINEAEVRKTYGDILDSKIFSYNVGASRDLAVLPNYKKLVMVALFGSVIPYKMDIADDGRLIAVNISL